MVVSPLRMAKKVACDFGRNSVVVVDRDGNRSTEITPSVLNVAGSTVNIMVMGEISEWWGVNKHDVYWALKNNPSANQVNVYISSPGGEVDTAFVIHDMLKGHAANVTAYLIGQCASAATVISCAANEVIMSEQCLFMIHKPSWFCWGDADDMRKGADILDKYQALIINVYKKKTQMDEARLNELMNQETWFEPSEALALGFVDSVVDTIELNFETPASGDRSGDGYYLYDSAESYRVAAFNALEKGLKPFKGDKKTSPKLRSTMFGTNFFSNLLKNLQNLGAVNKDADLEKLAADLAGDKGLVESLDASALDAAAEKAVAKAQQKAFTVENLVALVEGADAETKGKIANALKPKEEEEGEEEDDAVSQKVKDLEAEIAKLKQGGGTPSANGNGKAPNDGKKNAGEAAKVTKAQRELLVKSFKAGNISADQYTKLTGEEAPARN